MSCSLDDSPSSRLTSLVSHFRDCKFDHAAPGNRLVGREWEESITSHNHSQTPVDWSADRSGQTDRRKRLACRVREAMDNIFHNSIGVECTTTGLFRKPFARSELSRITTLHSPLWSSWWLASSSEHFDVGRRWYNKLESLTSAFTRRAAACTFRLVRQRLEVS